MIKAIITDVDGVMVGKRQGINFPLPPVEVIDCLRQVAQHTVPIVLCTAKFRVAIDQIIIQAQLNNPHITDAGALIINPLGDKKIIKQHVIKSSVVKDYLTHDQAHTELYSAEAYYIQKNADPEFARKRSKLLQMEPIIVDRLSDIVDRNPIIKIISFAENDDDMPRIEAQVKRLGDQLNFIWSYHPFIVPRRPGVMTAPGVTKKVAATEVADYLGVSFDEILGIGDSPADWTFMQLCGYVATIGDNKALQELVSTKDKLYVGKSVDENGIIGVLHHFGLQ